MARLFIQALVVALAGILAAGIGRSVLVLWRNGRVLSEIADQFRTDSGSSLRDVVNNLTTEIAAMRADRAVVASNLTAREHVVDDARATVASDLAVAKLKVEAVATHLSEGEDRANSIVGAPPGTAADAASQSAPSTEEP